MSTASPFTSAKCSYCRSREAPGPTRSPAVVRPGITRREESAVTLRGRRTGCGGHRARSPRARAIRPDKIEAWVAWLGPWGPLAFVVVYLLAPALFLPGSVLTLAGGALFGVVSGALLSLVGATGGAT